MSSVEHNRRIMGKFILIFANAYPPFHQLSFSQVNLVWVSRALYLQSFRKSVFFLILMVKQPHFNVLCITLSLGPKKMLTMC